MIFFDTTKSSRSGHRSGLLRVSSRLQEELGGEIQATQWPFAAEAGDWVVTTELFSETERPGIAEFLRQRKCRVAALFHDAIPLRHPHITWPQSVARHPGYMTMLAHCERVWAVSRASREDLVGFWRWQGTAQPPPVTVLPLGADFNGRPRVATRGARPAVPVLLCIGIVEPRKNQAFLLEACEPLWREGLRFELHFVGRINPHFGAPISRRIRAAARARPGAVMLHEGAGDQVVAALYARARATVFPTLAEGCGLPLLESLWMGVPCVCSDLAVLRENADGGGCLPAATNDRAAWTDALRRVLTDGALVDELERQAMVRPLPTWADAARVLRASLAG